MDIGFKPHRLLKNPRITLVEYEVPERFQSKKQTEKFMTTLMTHLVNRYGIEAMETWYFELWKDEYIGKLTIDDNYFYETFQTIATVVKRYVPNLQIGGGGFSVQYGRAEFSGILKEWNKYSMKPDFISVYIYPFVPTGKPGPYYAIPSTDEHFLRNMIADIQDLIRQSQIPCTRLHVSEWNITPSSRHVVNDSCNKGAYIMKNLIDSLGMVEMIGYWIGTDSYTDYVDIQHLLMGAGGLISKDMIPKPAFYAFEFMNRLGHRLISSGDNYLVSGHDHHNYSLVCHNFISFNNRYYLAEDAIHNIDMMEQLFTVQKQSRLHIQLQGLADGNYQIKTYSIHRGWGSIQDEWLRLGLVDNLSIQEISYLENICVPKLTIETVRIQDGTLDLDLLLEPSEIRCIYVKLIL